MYFIVFMIFYCANGLEDRINTILVHFKKISNFHVFCTQTYAKCGLWANLVPTCEYKTSRDLATDGPIFANLVSKDA